MSVTIKLKPEIEANLTALAAAQGVGLAEIVERLLEKQLTASQPRLLRAERVALWRAIPAFPLRRPLSDEAIDRAHLYDTAQSAS